MLKYEDISDIVEDLVKAKSRQYAFGFYEPADIGQEIRAICFKVLPKYDATRVEKEKIKNFFGRCVDNGLRNLKRDNYVRSASPYKAQFASLEDSDQSEAAQHIRTMWGEFQRRIKVRLGIVHAEQLSVIGDHVDETSFDEKMEYNDLERYLVENAPPNIAEDLLLMLEGHIKGIAPKNRQRVRRYVEIMLENMR